MNDKNLVMSKMSVAICLTFMLLLATLAHADHWEQNASLLPGTYMLVYINVEGSAQMDWYAEMARIQGVDSNIQIEYVLQGLVMTIGREFSTEKLVKYLNADPTTTKDQEPLLLRKDGKGWKQIPLPCKWIDVGDGFVI